MRFLADGPSIPDELLVARDEGSVIFFCGAGVSRARVQLPDFWGLARAVLNELGVKPEHDARKLIELAHEIESRKGIGGLISADRIFGLLERDFLDRDIEAAVAKALKPGPNVDLSAHRILVDLGRTPTGAVRLITTNFDLLFEAADATLRGWSPPNLPDPRHIDLEGIVHLHGQVDEKYSGAIGNGFVLTSSNFGRAYLSDGWATQFIRELLNKYLIVFVGYTADDPPVQYLLEALNRTSGQKNGIYAFQSGSADYAESRWRHKGVRPIAYDPRESHRALWETLSAWAERASNPDAWQDQIVELAKKSPAALRPHERGKVVHLISTVQGARRFATSNEPPHAEWLCVFDRNTRYLTPGKTFEYNEESSYFDPFDSYGLDSDPLPSVLDPENRFATRKVPEDAVDYLSATRLDRQGLRDDHFAAFRGYLAKNTPRLSVRLTMLGSWVAKVCANPTALWWALGQSGLHPNTQQQIQFQLRQQETCTADLRRAWQYLFESWQQQSEDFDQDRYELERLIERDGWTVATVRQMAESLRPYLKVGRPYGARTKPFSKDTLQLRQLLSIDVEYPTQPNLALPSEVLLDGVREFRRNLEHAVSLEIEITGFGLSHVVPIEPDPALGADSYERTHGISGLLLAYSRLFGLLKQENKAAAIKERLAWWANHDGVFARLRIWACRDKEIVSATETGQLLQELSDDVFWERQHQRDLLIVLKERWNDLLDCDKRRIERRILDGPPRWGQEESDYTERRARASLNRMHWLKNNGCVFGFDFDAESSKLSLDVPAWKSEYAESAVASMESRGGWVKTDEQFTELLTEPLITLLAKAQTLSGRVSQALVENDPFAGLSADRPVRALSALSVSAKKNSHPQWAWSTFLNAKARESDGPRLAALIAGRVARLPQNVLIELIHPVTNWLLKSSKALLASYPDYFDRLWTLLLSAVRAQPNAAGSSVLRNDKPADWSMEGLNAPVGKLSQVLMNDRKTDQLKTGEGFPLPWLRRVEELLALPDDLRRHALAMFAHSLSWFFSIDREWTEKNLISVFDKEGDDQSATWAGFSWGLRGIPSKELYARMKPYMLQRTHDGRLPHGHELEILAALLLSGWLAEDPILKARLITSEEMRIALLDAGEDFRLHVLWHLRTFVTAEEEDTLKTFFTEVWPRQKEAKTPKISAELCDFACSQGTLFPTVVNAILPVLTKIDLGQNLSIGIRSSNTDIVAKYPEATLALLSTVLPESASGWPYGVDDVLESIGLTEPSLLRDARLIDLRRRWNSR